MAVDFASGVKVSSPTDIVGDDDDAAHLEVLDDAAERVRKAWRKVQDADAAAKKRVQETARDALGTAKGLADGIIRHLPHTVAAEALRERAQEVKEKLKDTAKAVLPWYLAIGVGMWLVIGVGAYLLLEHNEKQRPERERVAKEFASRG
jgi:hypothetical protein